MTKEDYFYFGKIIKPHGYKGDLTIRFDVTNYFDYLDDFEDPSLISAFFIKENDGYIPYFIENIEPKNKGHFKIKFEDLDEEDTALSLRGKDIYFPIEKEIVDELEESINSWVGYEIINQEDKNLGKINDVIDYSGNLLLQITINSEDILIPFHEDWILDINEDTSTLKMEIPEGLLELNDE